mgnify:CR=1 FL=1
MELLIEKYTDTVESLAWNMSRYSGVDRDDLAQEAYLKLCEYSQTSDGWFNGHTKKPSFYKKIVRNAMIDYIRKWKSNGVTYNDEQLYY